MKPKLELQCLPQMGLVDGQFVNGVLDPLLLWIWRILCGPHWGYFLQKTAACCPDLSSTASVCYCLVYHEFCTRFEISPFKLNEDSHGTLRVMLNFLIYVCLH